MMFVSVPMAKVFETLCCDKNGLSKEAAEQRLATFGHNKLVVEQENKMWELLGFMWNPLSLVMEGVAIMAITIANGGGKPPDWQTFVGINVLLLINSTISFTEVNKASDAAAALTEHLALKTKVLRDGKWVEEDASILVPGDIISIKPGDIIPADAALLESDDTCLKIDQCALTGESRPITKRSGHNLYSGSICMEGESEAVVIATGVHSFFKAPSDWSLKQEVGRFLVKAWDTFEFCMSFIAVGIVVEIFVMYPIQQRGYRAGIDNLLVLLIGGIPIAMPLVLCVTMATGCHRLSQQGAITKRMSAIEKMAAMDVLCIDDTGTLTLNEVSVDRNQYAEQGLRSLAVAYQQVPDGKTESPGDPWQFIELIPLSDSPKHETIRKATDLGVNVKMITGNVPSSICSSESDQLAIGKETGQRLGIGTNIYPASALFENHEDYSISAFIAKGLLEGADGFTGVSPEHKNQIVRCLQERGHICGITGGGVDDVPALKKADIGIAVADATHAARRASDIVVTEPGLSVIISAVLTSRDICQKMTNYTIYAVSINVLIVLGFSLLVLIWEFDFPPFMVLIIVILNDGIVMTISKDQVKPSPQPHRWKFEDIVAPAIILGAYLAMMTVFFFRAAYKTDFFPRAFKVTSLQEKDVKDFKMLASAVFLQVSTISQALIFVTRSRGWSYTDRPGAFPMAAFVVTQMIATLIAVYANWGFAYIEGIGWRWAGVIWLYNLILYITLDPLKFFILSEKKPKREERQLSWPHAVRALHSLDPPETKFKEHNN